MQRRGLLMPTWNNDGRPINPVRGEFGFNIFSGELEVYDGSDWWSIALSLLVL
jgi:hypothetical protein